MRRHALRPPSRTRPAQRRRPIGWPIAFAALLATLGAIIAIWSEDRPYYPLGQIIEQPIVPRVEFTAEDKEATRDKRREARQQVFPHYTHNQALERQLRQGFDKLLAAASQRAEAIGDETRKQLNLNASTLEALRPYVEQGKPTDAWQQMEDAFVRDVFSMVVLTPDQYEQAAESPVIRIAPPSDDEQSIKSVFQSSWLKLNNASELHDRIQQYANELPEALRQSVLSVAMRAFSPDSATEAEPTYTFDEALTQQIQQQKVASVEPVMETFTPGDVMVAAGTKLDGVDRYLIEQERAAFRAAQGVAERWMRWLGMFGLFAAIAAGLWAYNFAYNDRLVRNAMRGLALTGLLLLMQLAAALLTHAQPEFIYLTSALPTLLAVVIITITYDRRFGLGVGAVHAAIVLLTLDLTVGLVLTLLTGVAVAVAQLWEIRTRSKLVTVGAWTGLAMAAVALLAGGSLRPLHVDNAIPRLLSDAGWAALGGFLTGMVAQGLLPGIERLFRVTTAMTLKELNDASHPLLQRLAQQAPGTYQHSLRIADMAEASADSIGADGLLCRVGAMYHDVGKINKPQYFIENQAGGPNRHSKLSPAMSLLIIVGHVKDGVEMAREYGLPPVIRHFIESHHGTTLVEYFYHAARRQQEAEAKPGPSEFEFRYPGPKPQTKEAAILLLCDSIEGAARSLDEPTPVRLDQVVHNMANKRLMDGQFDECNLTLKELARIEQAITKTLCAIYHGRIKYPAGESQPQPPASAEPEPTPQRHTAVS